MGEHAEGRRVGGVGLVALLAVVVAAVVCLGAACGGDNSTTANDYPDAATPAPNVPPEQQPTEDPDLAAEPTPHPCVGTNHGETTPRATWAPIDCVCLGHSIYWDSERYEIPTPIPTKPGGVLEVTSPVRGEEVTSPLVVTGTLVSDDAWLKIGLGGWGTGAFKVESAGRAVPINESLAFAVTERSLACLHVYQTGVSQTESMAGAVRVPVYLMPAE